VTAVPADQLTSTERTLRDPSVDVLRTLIGEHGERDTVLSIIGELVARNAELDANVDVTIRRARLS
jgi:hypothetical protein